VPLLNDTVNITTTSLITRQEAQLSQNDCVRRAMLINSCYVSWGTEVRKVSISKSYLQGHSRESAMVLFYTPHCTISY